MTGDHSERTSEPVVSHPPASAHAGHGPGCGCGDHGPAVTRASGGRKTGRNDPCPCGSGRKFKKCCGK